MHQKVQGRFRPPEFDSGVSATLMALFVALLGSLSGCASVQDFHYEQKQRLRTTLAYYGDEGQEPVSPRLDYRRGWFDGFYETVTGGPGIAPAVSPSRYWGPDGLLRDVSRKREAYYAGWNRGSRVARTVPDTHRLSLHVVEVAEDARLIHEIDDSFVQDSRGPESTDKVATAGSSPLVPQAELR